MPLALAIGASAVVVLADHLADPETRDRLTLLAVAVADGATVHSL